MAAEQRTRVRGPSSATATWPRRSRGRSRPTTARTPRFEDRGAYVRIGLPSQCRLTQESLDEELGGELPISAFETVMPSFAGRIKVTDDEIIWYLEEAQ